MVDNWSKLGFVVAKTVENKVEFVEDERPRLHLPRLNAMSSFSAAARRARRRPSRWRAPDVPSWSSRSRITSRRASARRCRPLPGRSLCGWQCGSRSSAAGHLPSPGVLSVWGDDELYETHFIFNPHGQGWHLDRQRFDTMLAQAARQAGAHLYCGAQVTSCLPLAGDRWQVAFTSGRRQHQLRATFLIDATGRAAVLAAPARGQSTQCRSAGWTRQRAGRSFARERRALRTSAIPARWLKRAPMDGGILRCCPVGRLMAVYMTDADLLRRHRGAWHAFWQARLQQTIHTQLRLRAFDLQAVPRVVAANSSRLDYASGRSWLAVGDAAMAFDPLSSQGLVQALASGIRAGEAPERPSCGRGCGDGRVRHQGE